MLEGEGGNFFARLWWSIRHEDYTDLAVLPLLPSGLIFGPNRLPYVLSIANLAVFPSAILMALIADRVMPNSSILRVVFCTSFLLVFHPLWVPALRGMPDAVGIVLCCGVLLIYISRTLDDQPVTRLIGLAVLLGLLVLTRRWYIFWVAAFFPAALLAFLASSLSGKIDWSKLWPACRSLAIIGLVTWIFLAVLAAPIVVRMALKNYTAAYAAYRPEFAAAGRLGQVPSQFGVALSIVCLLGLAILIRHPRSRALGILLFAQAAISLTLFMRVQGLMGVQHFYLLIPAAGIGLATASVAAWNLRRPGLRWINVAAIFLIVLASSTLVLVPSRVPTLALMPQVRHPPLVRPDLAEIDRLLSVLSLQKPQRVYVVSSSEVLNSDTLRMRCQENHRELCPHIARSADIDTRDGFPREVLEADYVILATPTQFHARPMDQQVVGLLASDLRNDLGIGSSFEPIPGHFDLWRNVDVQIYRRNHPIRRDDVEALSKRLVRSYPHNRTLFEWPVG